MHAAWDEQQEQGLYAAYPMIPGHEIAGRVAKVGKNVTKFKVGDLAGVGCMVNACGKCASCEMHKEQFCEKGTTFTYNSEDISHAATHWQEAWCDGGTGCAGVDRPPSRGNGYTQSCYCPSCGRKFPESVGLFGCGGFEGAGYGVSVSRP